MQKMLANFCDEKNCNVEKKVDIFESWNFNDFTCLELVKANSPN